MNIKPPPEESAGRLVLQPWRTDPALRFKFSERVDDYLAFVGETLNKAISEVKKNPKR